MHTAIVFTHFIKSEQIKMFCWCDFIYTISLVKQMWYFHTGNMDGYVQNIELYFEIKHTIEDQYLHAT